VTAQPEPLLSIVSPVYRAEEIVAELERRITEEVSRITPDFEIVLVDDGSPDRAWSRIEEACAADPRVKGIQLSRNFGQHPAVFAGFEHCLGDVVVTMDSDLQYAPEDIPRLVGELSPEASVVSGYRSARADPWFRRIISTTLSRWLSRATGSELRDYGSMFRAYDRSVVTQLLRFRERRRFVPALVGWLGVPVKEIPVRHEPRGGGGSRYRLGPLVDMFLDLITGYATFPLRILTVLGFAGAVLGLAATISLLTYRIVSGTGPSGLVSAFGLVFFLLGVQLFIVGLIGEYVGRVYIEAKDRPYYIVREVTRNP